MTTSKKYTFCCKKDKTKTGSLLTMNILHLFINYQILTNEINTPGIKFPFLSHISQDPKNKDSLSLYTSKSQKKEFLSTISSLESYRHIYDTCIQLYINIFINTSQCYRHFKIFLIFQHVHIISRSLYLGQASHGI